MAKDVMCQNPKKKFKWPIHTLVGPIDYVACTLRTHYVNGPVTRQGGLKSQKFQRQPTLC